MFKPHYEELLRRQIIFGLRRKTIKKDKDGRSLTRNNVVKKLIGEAQGHRVSFLGRASDGAGERASHEHLRLNSDTVCVVSAVLIVQARVLIVLEQEKGRRKMKCGSRRTLTTLTRLIVLLLSFFALTEAKILKQCDATKELQRAGISRTFLSNWICLMMNESGMDTRLVTGPKGASNYFYGVFQISSGKWCARGRAGGLCNKRCEDFANDDIQDDIVCAKKIQNTEGFKAWDGWTKKCKNKPLPNISHCRRRR